MKVWLAVTLSAVFAGAVCSQEDTKPLVPVKQIAKKRYKAGDAAKYLLEAEGDANGQDINLRIIYSTKVIELKEPDDAGISVKVEEFRAAQGDTFVLETPANASAELVFDKHGFPKAMGTELEEPSFALLWLAHYLPSCELSLGEKFKINWKGNEGSLGVTGTGTLSELKEEEGKKLIVLSCKGIATPSDGNEAELEWASTVDSATGSVVESEGSVSVVGGFTVKFKLSLQKEKAPK